MPAVVFDLGNVLIRWDPRNLYRKVFGADVDGMEWFLGNICTSEWNECQDAGRPFAEATAMLIERHPERAELIEMYYSRWEEMLAGPIEANVSVLRELKRDGTPVYALSNWSSETFPIARQRYAFLEEFDGIVLSGEERKIKPDPAIYRLLLSRFDLEPNQTVFIDDSLRNVEAARQLGMHAIQYEPEVDLRRELTELCFLKAK